MKCANSQTRWKQHVDSKMNEDAFCKGQEKVGNLNRGGVPGTTSWIDQNGEENILRPWRRMRENKRNRPMETKQHELHRRESKSVVRLSSANRNMIFWRLKPAWRLLSSHFTPLLIRLKAVVWEILFRVIKLYLWIWQLIFLSLVPSLPQGFSTANSDQVVGYPQGGTGNTETGYQTCGLLT